MKEKWDGWVLKLKTQINEWTRKSKDCLKKNMPKVKLPEFLRSGKEFVMFAATGCYVGTWAPKAPGTFGSLAALPLCWLLSLISPLVAVQVVAAFIIFSIWSAGEAEAQMETKDPGVIVIDEMAGMLVALAGVPFGVESAFFGFILFRIFDILKPFPVRYLDKSLGGGAGIVMDDIAAGILANMLLRVFLVFLI